MIKQGFAGLLFLIGLLSPVMSLQLYPPFAVAQTIADSMPQYFPSVAYSTSADLWLVVWQDGLPTGDETARNGRAQDIYACRIKSDGTLLDPTGIPICIAQDFQGRPVVASNGTDFLVAWQDIRTGKDWDVYAARVTADGVVQDQNGFPVSNGAHNQCMPELVYGGGGYYAIWLDARAFPEYRIFGSRISESGSVLDPSGKEILRITNDANMTAWQSKPFAPGKTGNGWHQKAVQTSVAGIVTNGNVHVVTAQANFNNQDITLDRAYTGVYFQTINPITGDTIGPRVMRNMDSAIEAVAGGGYTGLYQGNRLGLLAKGIGQSFLMGCMYYGQGFGAASDVRWVLNSISAAGAPVVAPWRIYTDSAQSWIGYRSYSKKPNIFKMAYDGGHILCVGDSHRHTSGNTGSNNSEILGVMLDSAGIVVEKGFDIANGANVQTLPAVSAGPAGVFLVIWQEESGTRDPVIMARIVNP